MTTALNCLLFVSLGLIVLGVVSGYLGRKSDGEYMGGYVWPNYAVWTAWAGFIGLCLWGMVEWFWLIPVEAQK